MVYKSAIQLFSVQRQDLEMHTIAHAVSTYLHIVESERMKNLSQEHSLAVTNTTKFEWIVAMVSKNEKMHDFFYGQNENNKV